MYGKSALGIGKYNTYLLQSPRPVQQLGELRQRGGVLWVFREQLSEVKNRAVHVVA
jgi:hypothetical protein